MNREILFRGKRLDNVEWVYGNLLRTDDGVYIIQNHVPFHMLPKYEVDPAAVDQYTGLTDKNGKKIFEGDIIIVVTDIVPTFMLHHYVVCWDNAFAMYTVANGDEIFGLPMDTVEVIGNIHDNPELLE